MGEIGARTSHSSREHTRTHANRRRRNGATGEDTKAHTQPCCTDCVYCTDCVCCSTGHFPNWAPNCAKLRTARSGTRRGSDIVERRRSEVRVSTEEGSQKANWLRIEHRRYANDTHQQQESPPSQAWNSIWGGCRSIGAQATAGLAGPQRPPEGRSGIAHHER